MVIKALLSCEHTSVLRIIPVKSGAWPLYNMKPQYPSSGYRGILYRSSGDYIVCSVTTRRVSAGIVLQAHFKYILYIFLC